MNTRSKAISRSLLEVNIDFNDASNEWHKNKKSIGNSQYKYICFVITNKNPDIKILCNKVCYKGSDKCWTHRNK
jgi:hypothetical protein